MRSDHDRRRYWLWRLLLSYRGKLSVYEGRIFILEIKLNFNGGIENMDKTTLHFFTAIKNGEVKHIGKSIIIQPEVKFGGGTIKWFDDKQLVKNKGEETC